MKWGFAAACFAAAVLAGQPAATYGSGKGDLVVHHPWARTTPPGAQVGAVYLELHNSGKQADRVVRVSTPAAERVELHVQVRESDVLKMREVQGFDVPAGQRLTLRPGGSHLMLVGLRKPLVAGERIPLTLRLERAGELKVEVEVQPGDSKKAHH